MKARRSLIVGSLAAVVVILVLLFVLVSPQPRISLTLVEYKKWPHGAMLLLSNGTPATIRYLSERNGTPAGNPVLCLHKTTIGWTNTSPTIQSLVAIDPITLKTNQYFYAADPSQTLHSTFLFNQLGAGHTVEFFVRLEPGGLPLKVGTVCCLPQGPLEKKLRPWLDRLQQWCRIHTSEPGQREVWCSTTLSVPSEPNHSAEN